MSQHPPNKSAVHRLYEVAECSGSGHVHCEKWQKSESNRIPVQSMGNLLRTMSERSDAEMFKPQYGRSFSYHGSSTWVGIGGHICGNGFTLQVRNQHNTQTNDHSVRVWEDDPSPCMKEFDSSLFQEVKDTGVNPMFHIEIERSGETVCNSDGLNLQLTFSTEVDSNYLILQQDVGSMQWKDITDECTTIQGSQNIEIPVKKSSKIWVIRLKKSLSSLKDAFLALIHGHVLFHILIYFLKKKGKIKVRIIGISEELYQNPKRLRTAVIVAEEDKFQKSPESAPKRLLRNSHLDMEVHKNEKYVSSYRFDVRTSDASSWHECSFYPNDLKDNLEVKIKDKDGNVLWSIDLNDILCDDDEPVEEPVTISKPDIASFGDEVCEHHLPWLARHLNKDVEKVAMLLRVDSVEIDAIKQKHPQTQNIKILNSWRKRAGNKPTWDKICSVLEDETVRRFDVIRALLNEDELDDRVLLWLAHRVAASFLHFARVLGLPECEIATLSHNYEGCEKNCMDVLQRWRQWTRTPTVEDLIKALEHDTIQRHQLAKEMRKLFCEKIPT